MQQPQMQQPQMQQPQMQQPQMQQPQMQPSKPESIFQLKYILGVAIILIVLYILYKYVVKENAKNNLFELSSSNTSF
jgi:cell division protein FtsL